MRSSWRLEEPVAFDESPRGLLPSLPGQQTHPWKNTDPSQASEPEDATEPSKKGRKGKHAIEPSTGSSLPVDDQASATDPSTPADSDAPALPKSVRRRKARTNHE